MLKKAEWILIIMLVVGLSLAGHVLAQEKAAKKASDKVLAKVGKETITEADLNEMLQQVPVDYRNYDVKKRLLDRMVEVKVFSQAAKKDKMEELPRVKARLEQAYDYILAKEFLIRGIKAKLHVTDEDMRKYFEAHKGEYVMPARIKAKHILVKDEAEAKKILARLKKGEEFEKLAKENSTCPSGKRGGDLGWMKEGAGDPDFMKAAFALKPGDLSGVVKSKFGYHIIKLLDKEDKRPKTYDEASDEIRTKLLAEQEQGLREKYMKKAGVQIFLEPEGKEASEKEGKAPEKK